MAGLIAKPPRLLLVHPNDSSTDTDSDSDDLSLCDLPIRAPSAPSAAVGGSNLRNGRVLSIAVDDQAPSRVDDDEEDNDPFEFFGTRMYGGHDMCSPPSVFSGGRMLPIPARASTTTTTSSLIASPLPTKAADANMNPNPRSTASYEPYSRSSHPSPASPAPMSRRSRSEAVRRPPRDAAVYNRSASVEGRGRSRLSGLGPAGRKGTDYRRLPPLRSAPQGASSPSCSSSSHKKAASGSVGTATCTSIDPVPSCGPRPKWYVFATFATVKPPQAEMDIKGIRTRQKKRNTQQQQQPADGAGAASGGSLGSLPTFRRLASEVRRGPNKSWGLLSSLSCRVDVDTLAWSPSDPPPLPLP